MARPNAHKRGRKCKEYLRSQIKKPEALFERFARHDEIVMGQQGHVTFKWPRDLPLPILEVVSSGVTTMSTFADAHLNLVARQQAGYTYQPAQASR